MFRWWSLIRPKRAYCFHQLACFKDQIWINPQCFSQSLYFTSVSLNFYTLTQSLKYVPCLRQFLAIMNTFPIFHNGKPLKVLDQGTVDQRSSSTPKDVSILKLLKVESNANGSAKHLYIICLFITISHGILYDFLQYSIKF